MVTCGSRPECTALLPPWGLDSLLHFHLESPTSSQPGQHFNLQVSAPMARPLKTLKLTPIKTVWVKYIEDPNTGARDSCFKNCSSRFVKKEVHDLLLIGKEKQVVELLV